MNITPARTDLGPPPFDPVAFAQAAATYREANGIDPTEVVVFSVPHNLHPFPIEPVPATLLRCSLEGCGWSLAEDGTTTP